MVAWAAGRRTADLAAAVVRATRARTARQAGVRWVSDGWEAYADTIWDTSTDPIARVAGREGWRVLKLTPGVALTQSVKHRHGRRRARVDIRAVLGPVAAQPYTVHIERRGSGRRDRLACVTRKTHAFAKQDATWDAAVGLLVFEHNWTRPHPALRLPLAEPTGWRRYHRRTPAMAVGLTDQCWSFVAFLTRPVPHDARE